MRPFTKFFTLLFVLLSSYLLAESLPFSPEILLSDTPSTINKSTTPSVAMNNKGEAVIVWLVSITDSEEKGNIFVSTRNPLGIWSKPFQINSKTGGSANISFGRPSVAINDNGEVLVAWQTIQPVLLIGNIYIASRNSNGVWSQEQQINSKNHGSYNISENPKAALNNSGEAIVCWSTNSSSNNNIFAASRNSQGHWSREQQINSKTGGSANFAGNAQIAMNNAGEAVVCWQNAQTSPNGIYAASRDSQGHWSDEQQISLQEGLIFGFLFPTVAMNNKGEAVVTWMSIDIIPIPPVTNIGFNIYAASKDPQGYWSNQQQINSRSSGSAYSAIFPQIVMNDSGDAIACWFTDISSNINNIYTATRDLAGYWSSENQVNNPSGPSANQAVSPFVQLNNFGKAALCWYAESDKNIFVSFGDVTNTWTQEQKISQGPSRNISINPRISLNDTNQAIVSWFTDTTMPNVYQAQTTSTEPQADILYRFSKTRVTTHYQK